MIEGFPIKCNFTEEHIISTSSLRLRNCCIVIVRMEESIMEVKVKVVFNFMMIAFSNARNFVVATCLPFKF